ncbi:MAG: transglutaminase domain-containing protein [Betaproteobacteria bacterium]|nr:transglutaminase domain-containing protein [Betaproteobacteria bacterium]
MSFTLSPLLVGASLLFWGWETSNLLVAAPLAMAAEVLRKLDLRFDLEPLSYNRLADLSTVAFVALSGVLVANRGVPHGVLGAFQYMPLVLTPILLAQYASSKRRIYLSSLFRYVRKQKQRDPFARDPLIDLSAAYVAVALLAAGMANQRGPTYFFAVLGFAAWALCPRRPAHASLLAWGAMFALAASLGYAGHLGLNRLQDAIEDWVSEWQLRQSTDPSRARTDLGSIGRLKQYDTILLRVYAPRADNARTKLLHRSSFNTLAGTAWIVRNAPLGPIQPQADGATWVLAPGDASSAVRIAAKSDAGRTLLPLPAGTLRVTGLVATSVRQNEFGATLAEAPESWIQYGARFDSTIAHYGAPVADDLVIPVAERSALEQLAGELGLRGLPAAEAARRVATHLSGFSYSTYREAETPRGQTPLSDFLTRSKSGHCEYFAAASVLMLRAAGVPARYATGFAALEYSELEGAWVVRARHAHAWTRAWVDGRWIDVDNTPASWFAEEAGGAPLWQPLSDFFRWGSYRWSQRDQGGQTSDWWYALVAALFAFLAWRVVKGRRSAALAAQASGAASRRWQGEDSEFYALERAIAERYGVRAAGETHAAWLSRVKPDDAIWSKALQALALHQRYRFDPQGLQEGERAVLRALTRPLATASSP